MIPLPTLKSPIVVSLPPVIPLGPLPGSSAPASVVSATLPTLTPAATAALAQRSAHRTITLNGYTVPATPTSGKAGTLAAINALTLLLQSGQITQSQWDAATNLLAAVPNLAPAAMPGYGGKSSTTLPQSE